MKMKLTAALAEKVVALTNEYHYAPEEILGIGMALASVLLEERKRGNRVLVISPEGNTVGEFRAAEPAAIHAVAQEYLRSVWSEQDTSAAHLVERLERERDQERPSIQ